MIKKWSFLVFLILSTSHIKSQSFITDSIRINSVINGILLIPTNTNKIPLAIIIQGSGPTDRDGNQPNLKNNSLKFLAEGIYKNNIATFRYDKRLVKLILEGNFNESDIDFNDFINDSKVVSNYFKNDNRFSEIIIIGHSQGSLVGMITAQENHITKFISIAGAGQEIDDVIVNQLEKQSPALKDNARQSFDDLRVNGVSQNYSAQLATIFRPSLQNFMFSWMQYNPQIEIAKLSIPVLIINGDKDIQVQVSEAELLKNAAPTSQLEIIPLMNHIFKEIKGEYLENIQSYNKEDLPVMPVLIETVSDFILNN
ncbi:MAG: alpha/beta hydrolase [Flavobacteriaceae bacterium]|nr:alpha/beta hydrolase [Flavobacteriaceae bacterium]